MSFLCGGIMSIKSSAPPKPAQDSAYQNLDAQKKDTNKVDDYEPSRAGTEIEEPHMETDWNVGEKIQSFSVLGALVNTSMLLISCMSFSLITVFRGVSTNESQEYQERVLLPVSRISSIIIMMAYVAYIIFQLFTHKEAMSEPGEDEDDGEGHLSILKSIALLFGSTLIVAFCSELLVGAIEEVTEKASLSQHFIGIILLPIVGNACEHAAAVRFAVQDKLGLSVSIAVGSSTQIALFVVPFSVLVGWWIDRPMDLDFGTLNSTMITLSVIVVLSMVVDGQSNWLQGYLLCSVYCIIGVMYWYLPGEKELA
jgi:Ca2+:H+ antiporter